MTLAIYAGSFDPVHYGHYHVMCDANRIFDKLFIVITNNPKKQYFFDIYKRMEMVHASFPLIKRDNIVALDHGLLADYARHRGVRFLVRGIRNTDDLNYEMNMACFNNQINTSIQTVFIPAKKQHSHLSSSAIKELIKNDVPVEVLRKYIPEGALSCIKYML